MRHLVLFDIDGTILRTGGAGRVAMEHALSALFGTPGNPSYKYDGKTDRQIVRELMREAGFSDAQIDSRMREVMALYVDQLETELKRKLAESEQSVGLYPGVATLIDVIERRDDAVLGLLTGNIEAGARLKLQAVGLGIERFRVNAFGSDNEVRGELPGIAHGRMRDDFGVTLEGRDVVVIGDTPADIACGRSLGARAIAVATGRYSVEELREHQPFAVFADLRDTDAVLAAIAA